MKQFFCILSICLFIQHTAFAQTSPDTICILQLNDVYEIGPLNQGKSGGMARVATLVKQHGSRYQTFVVLAGDFVSPSVIGTTKMDGQRVNGLHMVDIMNKTGVNLVTFGNHEFDIPENDLQQRINESDFAWVSSDVLHKNSNGVVLPFYKTKPDSAIIPTFFRLSSVHKQFTIGIITATIQSNRQPWVVYADHLQSIKKAFKLASKQSDIVVGLTHLSLAEDETLLRKLKGLRLVMGGHEHQQNYVTAGRRAIAKADANAKTVYRHLVFRSGKKGRIKIISELINVDTTVLPDPVVADAVKEWENKAYAAFRAIGLEPDAVVYHTKEQLDGTEASVRYKQTNLGNLIAQSMLAASPQADAAVFNSGSIRIDDMIEGVVTQLDIIRTLPFGGKLCEVDVSGDLLLQLLNTGIVLKGQGGYLQLSTNLSLSGTAWLLNGTAIDSSKTYKIVSPEFLFSGAEKGLEFLKEGKPGVKLLKRFDGVGDVRTDIRLAVVKYLAGLEGK
ncbi:MAG: bifunctional metallophosphatase/5'-nucleotidase [Ferruginibacter sp.]|nr:bifunctional metallophosphatase/5'-nucleotidase [Ferruginibacter sp.]